MRVALICSSLGAGGAERVLSTLAGTWAADGHQIRVITLSSAASDFYRLDQGVERTALDVQGQTRHPWAAVSTNINRILRVRRAVREAEVVVSFGDRTNVLALIATAGLGQRVLISERVDPLSLSPGRAWSALRRLLYPKADVVVVQTEAIAAWARAFVKPGRVTVIPNPLHRDFLSSAANDAPQRRVRRVFAMGRLVPQKGFDLLIDAFAALADAHPDWSLVIAGEGPMRSELQQRIDGRGLASRVTLPGVTSDAAAELARSEVFALSSRFEGFPNVLVEAMACGCAVVATDCRTGPSDIVRAGADGLLVTAGSAAPLRDGLATLMGDDGLRARLGSGARESARRFMADAISRQWQTFFAAAGTMTDGPAAALREVAS